MTSPTSFDQTSDTSEQSNTRLSDIEALLLEQFLRLQARTKEADRPRRLFAIEHGLDPQTIASLGHRLGSSLGDLRHMSTKHRLCWVVHATERGYSFGGLEYWDTFAEATPNWRRWGDRDTLRSFFEAFSKQFGGVLPSGAWAKRYKYISWPIAHALLPRDLQVQLAQAIYRARHHLYFALGRPDEVLGELVAHFAHFPTHRFSLFLRDSQAAGWIVRMLLRGQVASGELEPQALTRIIEDLRSEGRARAWLSESRGVYHQHSLRTAGGSLGIPAMPWHAPLDRDNAALAGGSPRDASLEPKLSLIRTCHAAWTPVINIPSFADLASRDDRLLDHLEMGFLSVPCHGTQMGPASTLLSPAGLQRTVRTWPREGVPLLSFEFTLPVFDDLVKARVQLRPSSMWLFKVRPDGVACQVLGLSVRPGEEYVLVARDANKLPPQWESQALACSGVSAVTFRVPDPVGQGFENRLQQVGLSASYSVTVEPVGSVPIGWSTQSLGEWLSTQTPCFVLKRDHDFTHYTVRVQGGSSTHVACSSSTEQFVALRGLTEGRHSITISTHAGGGAGQPTTKVLRTATLQITIRQPRSWTPGRQTLPAMLVTCRPTAPTFSEFIAGRVSLRADGDPSRQVEVRLELLDGSGTATSSIHVLKQPLPLQPEVLRQAIASSLNGGGNELDFLSFDAAEVIVDGGDLGSRRIVLQQAVPPLRWRYAKRRTASQLVLVDDLEASPVRVRRASFDRPAYWESVPLHHACSGIDAEASPGLYEATNADQQSLVVVSPPLIGGGFDQFRVDIRSHDLPDSIDTTLRTYQAWAGARACGLVSRQRQRQVLHALQLHGIGQMAGWRWLRDEQALGDFPSQKQWHELEATAHRGTNYGILLAAAWAGSPPPHAGLVETFANITMRLRLAEDPAIARLAWRLSLSFDNISDPDLSDAGGRFSRKLGSAMRGARLLRLFIEKSRSVEGMEEACKQ